MGNGGGLATTCFLSVFLYEGSTWIPRTREALVQALLSRGQGGDLVT